MKNEESRVSVYPFNPLGLPEMTFLGSTDNNISVKYLHTNFSKSFHQNY